jgi:hypothetical protein
MLSTLGILREVWAVVSAPARKGLRAYRRTRWRSRPGWVALTYRKPPEPDIILLARGSYNVKVALWEVQGPASNYSLPLPGSLAASLAHDFPAAGFTDLTGRQPTWDQLPSGRYWAVLYAWEGSERVPVCKVPFRVYDTTSRFWRWYEGRFVAAWKRRFQGPIPGFPQIDPQSPGESKRSR